ncbi:MAG: hypothetical protein RJB38_869, partial [Pseudomonadota bacterium]
MVLARPRPSHLTDWLALATLLLSTSNLAFGQTLASPTAPLAFPDPAALQDARESYLRLTQGWKFKRDPDSHG